MIPFAKYVGCGNDFILIDNRDAIFLHSPHLIRSLCERCLGIGADGIVLLENSLQADAKMHIFNSDGSEAEMCGNGIRCLISWVSQRGIPDRRITIETNQGVLKGQRLKNSLISIEMSDPKDFFWDQEIIFDNDAIVVDYLNTGVPHVVHLTGHCDAFELNRWGPFIRNHPYWQPKGTNFTIGQRLDSTSFSARTYERGVEGETLACGTGAVALALASARKYHLNGPLKVITKSKDPLYVDYKLADRSSFSQVVMIGPAKLVYTGSFNEEEFIKAS